MIKKQDFGLYGCFAKSIAGENHAIIELRGKLILLSVVLLK